MRLDTTRFPQVFLHDEDAGPGAASPSAEAQLEALLERGERFVLLTDHLPGEHDRQEESHADRRERALFFKRNKDRLRRLCGGLVLIQGERTVPAPVRIAAQAARRVLGFPLVFARSAQEAQEEATRLLARQL
ncbi:hypothetical protein [Xylophilus sp.]|uniref:hypothetical protein n=1 Tax=Xylophilus sp. TaxID=2653893 RepID=UPI0013B6626A|nr:hypothetical protein [Xylophilus sp.]KAF1045199.1 MAG: hypothetical protein GAK38_03160 [Xylophilus sp.]